MSAVHSGSASSSCESTSKAEPRWPSLRNNLSLSSREGAAYGVMVGMGETYLPAFALAMGMGEVTAGLVASVPLLVGGLLQCISLRAIHWLGSYKLWIVTSAAVQAISLLPLVAAAMWGALPPLALLLIASIYWAGGLAAGPAWNTWIGHLVPSGLRSRFFAKRTRLSQITTLCGFLSGGVLLQSVPQDWVLPAFAVIFSVASVFRFMSVWLLLEHHESRETQSLVRKLAAEQANLPTKLAPQGMRLIAYLVVVQGMVQISGPYFTPYMIKQLHFNYGQYVFLVAAAFVAKAVSLVLWGHLAGRRGARFLLFLGGISIIPLASLWTLSQSFAWVLCVQLLSGTLWAAYELGFFLMFFESMPVPQRARMLTIYNLANTCAWCVGSLIGGSILSALGPNLSSYWTIFALSSFGRLLALGLLFRIGPSAELYPRPRRKMLPSWPQRAVSPGTKPELLASIDSPSSPLGQPPGLLATKPHSTQQQAA